MARLLLFASAREAAGTPRDTIGGATVAEVLSGAKQQFGPSFASVLESCTVWLNGEECTPDAVVSESDEVAILPPVSGGANDFSALTLPEVRALRTELQAAEDAVSFVRRLAQGRLDMVREEQRRRSTGESALLDVTDGIARVFAAERGTGSNRPPRDTAVVAEHPLLSELETLCVESGFGNLRNLDDADLVGCRTVLAEFESRMSIERKQLFTRIDELSNELVQRYRTSSSDVDALLDEGR